MTRDPYPGLTPRAAAVRRYFTPTPPRPSVAGPASTWLLGVGLIGFGLAAGGIAGLLALVGVVLFGRGGYRHLIRRRDHRRKLAWAEPKPSDQQMDYWLYEEGVGGIKRTSRQRLHLVRSDEASYRNGSAGLDPLVIHGMPRKPPPDFRMAVGRDGQLRFTHYDIIVFFLTKWHLCVYQCVFEMESGFTLRDETKEFAYRDVVSLATASDRITMPAPLDHAAEPNHIQGKDEDALHRQTPHLTTQQLFRLRVASDEITTLVGIRFEDQLITGEFGKSDVERTLQLIRAKLREYTQRREEYYGTDDFDRRL
ncbi:hypothetical protein ACPYPG_03195 [Streptomyces sp. FR-108]|uniref:hypothetical protein n=1 Tax=Streptomyces sp. FR-108 TaxID=3416665 RepID=UPI003CF180CE